MSSPSVILFCGLVVPFIVPLWLGARLARAGAENPLRQFAGWLTLKPLVATPLWMLLIFAFGSAARGDGALYVLLSLTVGLGLTVAIAWRFRGFMGQYSGSVVQTLLVLDTVRWGNTVFLGFLLTPTSGWNVWFALALPTIFAVVAWNLCADR